MKTSREELAEKMGISQDQTMFATRVVEDQKIPFEVVAAGEDPFYSEENMAVLLQSIKDANEGKLTEHDLIED